MRKLMAVALVAIAVTIAGMPLANPAEAAPTGRVVASPSLRIRSDASTSATVLGAIPYNTTVGIQCTKRGTTVQGNWGPTNLWNRVSYRGVTGFVSDGWLFTGSDNPVAGACSTGGSTTVGASPARDDYPFRTTPVSARRCCQADPWGAFKWQCTSFAAFRLRQAGSKEWFAWGNAGQWATTARNKGYRVDTSPRVGSVAHWGFGEQGLPYGHVAIVQQVLSDGRVYVEEYNWVNQQYSRRGPLRAPRYLHVRNL